MQLVHRWRQLKQLYHKIAGLAEYAFIPFHRRASGYYYAKRSGIRHLLHTVALSPLYLDYGSQWCLDIAIARGLAAPRTAVYIELIVDDTYNGVVIVHEVAPFDVLYPEIGVCALSSSTFGGESIAVAIVAHKRCMDEKRVESCATEGIQHHYCRIESERAHYRCTVQCAFAFGVVAIGLQQTAAVSVYVLHNKLIATTLDTVYNGLAVARIKYVDSLSQFFVYRLQTVVYRQRQHTILVSVLYLERFV